MTEENMFDDNVQESELDALKARATQMGIKFHPSSGIDSLKEKINARLAEDTTPAADVEEDAPAADLSPKQLENAKRIALKKEATRLIRVRVANMNPSKKEWEGEIFTTGNLVTGTIKKYVPFDVEFHVPKMILDMIQARECQVFHTVTDPRTRQKTRKGKLVKEFAVEILPALTESELRDLAQRQAMANGTGA